jgi:hypothetical protein
MVASLWPFLLPYSSNVGLYAFSEVRLQHGAPVGLYSRIVQGAAVVLLSAGYFPPQLPFFIAAEIVRSSATVI